LQQLSRQEFACREDALTALKQWQKSLDWHKLEDQQVVEKCHYGHRGKPRLQEQPTRRSYHVQATFGLKQSKVPTAQRQAGRFVLATNQLGTCVGIIFQPENRSVEEPDQPDGTLSKRKSLSIALSPLIKITNQIKINSDNYFSAISPVNVDD